MPRYRRHQEGMTSMDGYQSVVVNVYGGPGAGKTTLAHDLVSGLSKAGVLTEYVAEYPKELVWKGRRDLLDGSTSNQRRVTGEQWRRIEMLLGKVEAIVTDSPVALGLVYADQDDPEYDAFAKETVSKVSSCSNFNVFVLRRDDYDQRGRMHDEDESIRLDREILDMLADELWARCHNGEPLHIDSTYEHRTNENNFSEVLEAVKRRVELARKAGCEGSPWRR